MNDGGIYGLMTIIGPILLAAVILWAIMRNRAKSRPRDIAETEAATRDLYKQQDAADKARDNRVER